MKIVRTLLNDFLKLLKGDVKKSKKVKKLDPLKEELQWVEQELTGLEQLFEGIDENKLEVSK